MYGDVVHDEMTNLIGRVLGGRYRIVRAIGAGGMGTVFEADQLGLERRVAVKVLKDTDPRALARLRQEALTAGAIRSPHVVAVFDFQANPGEPPFVVMELLEGESLSMLLRRERALLPARAARIASQLLAGLDAAHRAGVIHRDIKPSNIWLSRSLAEEIVKLLDFGIVKTTTDRSFRTTTGSILGTPGYFSPEQLRGMPIDARSDLHAIGVVLFEMLAGRKPWSADGPIVFAEILDRVPPPVSTLVAGVPPRLSDVVARALAKEPAARFGSAAEMLAALAPFAQTSGSIPFVANAVEAVTSAGGNHGGTVRGPYPETAPHDPPATVQSAPPMSHGVPLLQSGPPPTLATVGFPYTSLYPGSALGAPAPPPAGPSRMLPLVAGLLVVALLAGGGALAYLLRGRSTANAAVAPASASPSASSASAVAAAVSTSTAGAMVRAIATAPSGSPQTPPPRPADAGAPASSSSAAVARAAAPRSLTPADTIACVCKAVDDAPFHRALCIDPSPPTCDCRSPEGWNICATRWSSDGECSEKNKIGAFSGPGRKTGDACSGFYKTGDANSVPSNGKLSCVFCSGHDMWRVAQDKTPCHGISADGTKLNGLWFCGPR